MKRILLPTLLLAPTVLFAQVLNEPKIALRNWATGLSEPVHATHAGDSRLFVCERAGKIKIISDSMTVVTRPFLDITGPVNSGNGEQGLLSLAFEPNYQETGYFYVYYIGASGPGVSRLSRFQVSIDPDSADVASEEILWEYPQPYSNHNGGDLHFDQDGYLYLSLGDGGSGNDPVGAGQDYLEPLGGILRFDVSAHDDTYLIPPTNPFAYETGSDTLPEIWATGLRNPFRWSFDRVTGDLWLGDVGQNAWEELNHWPAGDNSCPNFGWRCREGFATNTNVDQTDCLGASAYVSPLAAFENVATGGDCCSMIGGYVYRGAWYPHLYGQYVFTDYCSGDFLTFQAGSMSDVDTLLMTTNTGYAGFGEDASGELYAVDQLNGRVRKIYDPCPMADPVITSLGDLLTAEPAGNAYQWYLDGEAILNATGESFWAPVSGNYQVTVTYSSNCTLISDTVSFIASGMSEERRENLRFFPQPARDELIMEWAGPGVVVGLSIVDAAGREVMHPTWPSGIQRASLGIGTLPAGAYTARVILKQGGVVVKPMVVAR